MHQDHSDINTAAENSPQAHENQAGPESEIISHNKLLEAGTYFGHKKDKWNPKMKPYISATKKGMHIIDTKKTKKALEFAYTLIERLTSKGASFIFVGTRKQARETIRNNALRTNSHYVADRWLGGTLTNAKTIFSRVKHMEDLEQKASNDYAGYTKKEGLKYAKELEKLRRNLVGIRRMKSSPNIMIVADPIHDKIAVREARKLGVKVIGIVDTNADPTFVDVAIPANDDSIKSVTLIITILADAIAKAKGGQQLYAYQGDDAVSLPEDRRERLEERQGRGRFGQQRRRSSNLRNNPRPGYSKPKEKAAATPSETTGQTAEPKTEKESDQDGTNREN